MHTCTNTQPYTHTFVHTYAQGVGMYGDYANGDMVHKVEDINPTFFKPSIAVGPGNIVLPFGTKVHIHKAVCI